MKRWTAQIVMCVILGAFTAWIVAERFRVTDPAAFQTDYKTATVSAKALRMWNRYAPTEWGLPDQERRESTRGCTRLVVSVGDDVWVVAEDESGGHYHPNEVIQRRFGWPWRSRSGIDVKSGYVREEKNRFFVDRTAVDARVIWPGLCGNVITFSMLWLLISIALAALAQFVARDLKYIFEMANPRASRIRRGRCPLCAYDLRGDFDNGCPECGWNRSNDQPPGEAGG